MLQYVYMFAKTSIPIDDFFLLLKWKIWHFYIKFSSVYLPPINRDVLFAMDQVHSTVFPPTGTR